VSTTTEKDAPMPAGVEAMTKQELWNWFHRSTQAAAEQLRLREKFFTMTTGLHSARSTMLGDPPAIIEAQRARIRGVELQMAQMQKGYDKKLRKAVAKTNAQGAKTLGLLRRIRMNCLALDATGEPTFVGAIDRGIYDEMCTLLLEHRLETLPAASRGEADDPEPLEEGTEAGQFSARAPGHA
jgi:hypothetical protein